MSVAPARPRRRAGRAALLLLALAAPRCQAPFRPDPAAGLVVEQVEAAGAAAAGGLQAGDVLLGWEVQPAGARDGAPAAAPRRGRFEDPFDVGEAEIEEAARGTVRLRGLRAGQPYTWTLPAGDWGLRPQPRLSRRYLRRYTTSRDGLSRGAAAAAARGEAVARAVCNEGRWRDGAWVLLRLGEAAARGGLAAEAARLFAAARAEARSRSPVVEARTWEAEAAAAMRAGAMRAALKAAWEALRLREGLRAAGPETLAVAAAHVWVAFAAYRLKDYDTAEAHARRSLEIRKRWAPDSLPVAESLAGLAAVSSGRGRLAEAQGFHEGARAIRERLAPRSLVLGQTLAGLGNLARWRGDLTEAEPLLRRAVDLFEQVAPDSISLASTFNSLGILYLARGDWPAAETYLKRALEFYEKLAPESIDRAACLNNLGLLFQGQGQLDEARAEFQRALEIGRKVNPNHPDVGAYLHNLGRLTHAQGDAAAARPLLEDARRLLEARAPLSLALAANLAELGRVALSENRLDDALALHSQALAIRRRVAPGSAVEAESLGGLASVRRAQGRTQEALRLGLQGVAVLEAQRGRLAVSERSTMGFGALHVGQFFDLVELMVELGQRDAAFQMLERSRARSFLNLLGQRDLAFSGDNVPAELLRQQREVDAQNDAIQAELAPLDPERDARRVMVLQDRLQRLSARRAEIAEAVARSSPRLMSLHKPRPLDVAGARRALDPGTLLLSYAVGKRRTLLFALPAADTALRRAGPLAVSVLPLGEAALRQRVEVLRGLIEEGQVSPRRRELLVERARRLYDDLLGPVRRLLEGCRRVLIVPDGPLHDLPFAALVGPEDPPRPLVEHRPLHVAASVTVYAELRKARRARRHAGPALVVFAAPLSDPQQPEAGSRPAAPRPWMAARARALGPLPFSAPEARAVAALYPGAELLLGAEATEERAKALGPGPRLIHFACHGLLDARAPLESSLVLSSPRPGSSENGLLQAWEVFERVRIEADLVTLSACNTARGRQMGGEGLVGLSRAFQYAGARSVLASLWAVSDRSTADLMARFYSGLQRGLAKDEALRSAQVEMLRLPGRAHPFHWAAFQVLGDVEPIPNGPAP